MSSFTGVENMPPQMNGDFVMPSGKHHADRVCDLPDRYLKWVSEEWSEPTVKGAAGREVSFRADHGRPSNGIVERDVSPKPKRNPSPTLAAAPQVRDWLSLVDDWQRIMKRDFPDAGPAVEGGKKLFRKLLRERFNVTV